MHISGADDSLRRAQGPRKQLPTFQIERKPLKLGTGQYPNSLIQLPISRITVRGYTLCLRSSCSDTKGHLLMERTGSDCPSPDSGRLRRVFHTTKEEQN